MTLHHPQCKSLRGETAAECNCGVGLPGGYHRRPAPPATRLQAPISAADDIPTRAAVIWHMLGVESDDAPQMIGHIVAVLEKYAELEGRR